MSLLIESNLTGGNNTGSGISIDTSNFTKKNVNETIPGHWTYNSPVNISVGDGGAALYIYNYGSGDPFHVDCATGGSFTVNHNAGIASGFYGVNDSIDFLLAHDKNIGDGWWRGIEINDRVHSGGIEYVSFKSATGVAAGTGGTSLGQYVGFYSDGYRYADPLDHMTYASTYHFKATQDLSSPNQEATNVYGFYSDISNPDIVGAPQGLSVTAINGTTTGYLPGAGQGNSWTDIAFGNGKYVAILADYIASGTPVASSSVYSSDGVNWTTGNLPGSIVWEYLSFANGTFFAMGPGVNTHLMTSTDGISWSNIDLSAIGPGAECNIAYGNSTYVGVFGTASITSTNGSSWVMHGSTLPNLASRNTLVFGNGVFVTLGDNSQPIDSNKAFSSTDGISWTEHTLPVSATWSSIIYANGQFVATAKTVGGQRTNIAITSSNGINWTQITIPATEYWYDIDFNYDTFIFVSGNGVGHDKFITTKDFITWTSANNFLPAYSYPNYKIAFGDNNAVLLPSLGINGGLTSYTQNGNFVAPTFSIDMTISSIPGATTPSTLVSYNFFAGGTSPNYFGGNIIANAAIIEKQYDLGTAAAINLSFGSYFTKAITANTVFTISNVAASAKVSSFILELYNAGSFVIGWWGSIKWEGGTAPTLTVNGKDILTFYTYDGGTTWYGVLIAKDIK